MRRRRCCYAVRLQLYTLKPRRSHAGTARHPPKEPLYYKLYLTLLATPSFLRLRLLRPRRLATRFRPVNSSSSAFHTAAQIERVLDIQEELS
jgi:hypothetical protein